MVRHWSASMIVPIKLSATCASRPASTFFLRGGPVTGTRTCSSLQGEFGTAEKKFCVARERRRIGRPRVTLVGFFDDCAHCRHDASTVQLALERAPRGWGTCTCRPGKGARLGTRRRAVRVARERRRIGRAYDVGRSTIAPIAVSHMLTAQLALRGPVWLPGATCNMQQFARPKPAAEEESALQRERRRL
jgi:hypothetical protein